MQQFAGISLKTRLYLLVLAAFIPVAVLIVYVAEEQKAIESQALLHRIRLLARAAADAENQQLEATGNFLLAVANAFLAVDGQAPRLSPFLTRLLNETQGYAAVGIVDPGGRLLASGDPSAMDADYAGRAWLTDAIQQKHRIMGQYHDEHIRGQAVLYFALPVLSDDGQAIAVVFVALDLNRMNRVIFRQLTELPHGSRLTLLDERRGMLRYDVDSASWSIPSAMDADLRQQITRRQSGSIVAADENRKRRIYAFAPMTSALRPEPVSIVLEMPRDLALSASTRIFSRNLAMLALSALMAVLAIWWAADAFILRRVKAMVQASRRLAAGDLKARIGRLGVNDELNHLAGVFDEMAAALQMRLEREEQMLASLAQSREQLRGLSAHQNAVREEERHRIAREIHDQLGQSLTILKMDLAWLKRHQQLPPGDLSGKIDAMFEVIEAAMDNLHAVIAELRPVILDDFGLAAAIEWQAEAFTRHSGIACRLENDGFEPELSKGQATALFRIFQETLTNIMRHAQASAVTVHLARCDGELVLEVADNGCGITSDQIEAPHAFGLIGIRERLHPFGGRVDFTGQSGQGTVVTIHLPLPPEGESP